MKRKIIQLSIKLAVMLATVYVLFFWVFRFARVASNSMAPNMMGGDLALIFRFDKNFGVGDVVSFKRDGVRHFARILAINEGIVEIRDDMFYVDGIPEESSHAYIGEFLENMRDYESPVPYVVTENMVYLAADNRDEVEDSRSFGAIEVSEIEGKVISIFRTRCI